jgi:GMP synthase (glutamine-hydrolysing)
MQPTLLLLQARLLNDRARHDEHRAFADRAQLPIEHVATWDLLSGPPTLADVRRYDALTIGGSGAYYVSKGNLPSVQVVYDVLRDVVAVGHPLFASCFGFHLLVQALGGEVIYDPVNMEVGSYQLTLAEAGRSDVLFKTLPPTFMAQLGHKDRAARLPDGVLHLASSVRAPFQALRVPGKPIWATQFHPELTGSENLRRFKLYLDDYAAVLTPEELQETIAGFQPSPDADQLLSRFMRLLFSP